MNEIDAPKVNIGGTGISNVTLDETIALFGKWIREGDKKRICVTPVNCVVWASENPQLQHIYNSADLTLCDGVPLIWASEFLGGNILRGRVTGLDLLPAFSEYCYRNGFSMFFLGSTEQTNAKIRNQLEMQYPGIRIAGTYSPPFVSQFTAAQIDLMVSAVNETRPDILWVSLTAPKQDYLIYETFSRLNVKIAVGIGGALDVMAGNVQRAPAWMQSNGLEWLFRFLNEPKRLFRRYFIEAPRILPLLIRQKRGKL